MWTLPSSNNYFHSYLTDMCISLILISDISFMTYLVFYTNSTWFLLFPLWYLQFGVFKILRRCVDFCVHFSNHIWTLAITTKSQEGQHQRDVFLSLSCCGDWSHLHSQFSKNSTFPFMQNYPIRLSTYFIIDRHWIHMLYYKIL